MRLADWLTARHVPRRTPSLPIAGWTGLMRAVLPGWLAASAALCLTACASGPQAASHRVGLTHPIAEMLAGTDTAATDRTGVIASESLPFSAGLAAPVGTRARQLLDRAEMLHTVGDHAAALTALRRIRDVEPRCTAGLGLEAQIALDRGDRAGCAIAAQAASAAHPDSAEIQLRVGSLLVQLGELRGGLLALETAHRLMPNDVRVARSLAAAYVSMQILPAAEMVLKSALLQTPGDAGLSIALARLSE